MTAAGAGLGDKVGASGVGFTPGFSTLLIYLGWACRRQNPADEQNAPSDFAQHAENGPISLCMGLQEG
jgi:hypothetical protein